MPTRKEIRENKELEKRKHREKIIDDVEFVSDMYEEALKKTNKMFRHVLMKTEFLPSSIARPYRHRVRTNGINSITLKRKIELLEKYIINKDE